MNKMKLRGIQYLTILSILFWLIILLLNIFPVINPISTDLGMGLFILVEFLAVVLLILPIKKFIVKKSDPGNAIIVFSGALLIQFLPLLVRLLVSTTNPKNDFYAILVTLVMILIYLGMYFSFDLLNRKVNDILPNIKGNTVEIVDEKAFEKDGKFIGVNKQKKEE